MTDYSANHCGSGRHPHGMFLGRLRQEGRFV